MFESFPPPEPPPKHPVHRPLIGLAISICAAVVSFLVGIVSFCGTPGNGFNGGGAPLTFLTLTLLAVFGLFLLSIGVCFVWFVVALLRQSTEE